jgi:3'-5' exoribonuclease
MNEKSGPPEDERGNYIALLILFDELITSIRDHNIAKFLQFFLLDTGAIRKKFFTAPGARGENPGHHSFKGGLAYHTLYAAKLAGKIADHYNDIGIPVNRDIVVAGTILHDVGKMDCYEWKEGPRKEFYHGEEVEVEAGYTHTKVSKMFHHIPHGFQLFMSRAYDFCERHENFPEQFKHTLTEKKIQKLGHIILSHHGRRSWSSPVVPQFVEAYIVHLVEMGDSWIDKYNKGVDVREIYDH